MRSYVVRAAVALATVGTLSTVLDAAQPSNARAFQKCQAAAKTTLIHVGASWCATCRRQQPIIDQIERELPDSSFTTWTWTRRRTSLSALVSAIRPRWSSLEVRRKSLARSETLALPAFVPWSQWVCDHGRA